MASMFSSLIPILLVALLVVAAATPAESTVSSCTVVVNDLKGCMSYVTGKENGKVPDGCCTGMRSLAEVAKTVEERRNACLCIKNLSNALRGFDEELAAGLPQKCGVNVPYDISNSTNCDSVK